MLQVFVDTIITIFKNVNIYTYQVLTNLYPNNFKFQTIIPIIIKQSFLKFIYRSALQTRSSEFIHTFALGDAVIFEPCSLEFFEGEFLNDMFNILYQVSTVILSIFCHSLFEKHFIIQSVSSFHVFQSAYSYFYPACDCANKYVIDKGSENLDNLMYFFFQI